MNNKTLIKLEFDKIISMLENEASSFRGKQLCRRLKPVTDLTKIDLLQEQTAAAFTRIIKKGRILSATQLLWKNLSNDLRSEAL